ncbi:dicarboxylate/amino acid:cation symporter [Corallincola luteus]|uniref:Dicarboxylate/amino acid:cation symporter n=2 Tax=Corallincola TaxID=1775176 RepID=A0A368NM30_9GAMM|nr:MULTISPECIES: dicarboxylate/amino acid:cation symporter [Corallincola]RCU50499.1 dicarboxylate/amino acid:cation symporter [Corallincola holothuriorum]TCI01824.1 dicarboxylate/amino acid:cation symporter [Corallincola luteus]
MLNQTVKYSLTTKILIGMFLGILTGVLLRNIFPESTFVDHYFTNGLFDVIGKIFVASLKMLVVPLVFVSLVCGTCSLSDASTLGRLGFKSISLYLVTTAIAISLAIGIALLISPGEGVNLTSGATFDAKAAPTLSEVFINLFPSNPIKSMAEGNMLQIIVFALLFGISMAIAGPAGQRLANVFEDLNAVIMKLVSILMNLAPYGVYALMAKLFIVQDFSTIANLMKYFLVVFGTLLIHALITYPVLLKALSGLSPVTFLIKMRDAVLFAFSTSSSNATIPVTLETVTRKLGVKNKVASFTVPLGATINMDGTAIMQGVATVFIAQVFSMDLTLGDYLMVILTATLASVGTAGVPGVGLIMLAMVLQQVGLPVEGIALIIGVDRLLDMTRTAVNVTGDCMVTCVVGKSEKQMDLERYHAAEAGLAEEEVHLER